MSSIVDFLADGEREAIELSVREAERRTSGQIVPYVVGRSDAYEMALWKASLLGALAGSALALLWVRVDAWSSPVPWCLLGPATGAALGWALASWAPGVKRRLVPAATMGRQVHLRAEEAFLDREVFRTRERTGILIFVSLFERRVVLLADSGIHARVEEGQWDKIVAGIVVGIRDGRAAEALVAAIGACGAVLERAGLAPRIDATNELPDALNLERE